MTKLSNVIILILMLLPTIVFAETVDITTLPYQQTIDVVVNTTINETITLQCNNCTYTAPTQNNITPSENLTTIQFNITIPTGTPNQQILETWTVLPTNETVPLNLNISLPESISIIMAIPYNGQIYTRNDPIPSIVQIFYDGTINFNASDIKLKHEGQNVAWITTNHSPTQINFTLNRLEDGKYTGEWTLVDLNNNPTYYNYTFEIRSSKPPKPVDISPSKGQYTDEKLDLQINMPSSNYTLYFMTSDQYPTELNSNWKKLTSDGQLYRYTIDFLTQPIGAIYIKIMDDYGNTRIHPTGIISAPSFDMVVDEPVRSVLRETEIQMEISINRKLGSGNLLRCRMSDFTANQGTSIQKTFPVKNNARLLDDRNELSLTKEYDQTITLFEQTHLDLNLWIDIPNTAVDLYDYFSDLQCILGGTS